MVRIPNATEILVDIGADGSNVRIARRDERSEEMTTYVRMLIRRLSRLGITAEIAGTGGGCMAVVIPLNGAEILVTNGDAELPTSDNVLATLTLEGEDEPVFLHEQSPAPVRDVLEIVAGWVADWSLDK